MPINLSFVSFIGVNDGINDICDIWIDAQPTLNKAANTQYQIIATIVVSPLISEHGKHSSNTKKKHNGTIIVPAKYHGFRFPILVSNLSE